MLSFSLPAHGAHLACSLGPQLPCPSNQHPERKPWPSVASLPTQRPVAKAPRTPGSANCQLTGLVEDREDHTELGGVVLRLQPGVCDQAGWQLMGRDVLGAVHHLLACMHHAGSISIVRSSTSSSSGHGRGRMGGLEGMDSSAWIWRQDSDAIPADVSRCTQGLLQSRKTMGACLLQRGSEKSRSHAAAGDCHSSMSSAQEVLAARTTALNR